MIDILKCISFEIFKIKLEMGLKSKKNQKKNIFSIKFGNLRSLTNLKNTLFQKLNICVFSN